MFRFETLDIWKEAAVFVDKIYIITSKFPKGEMFTLTNQLRRAAISVSANIAEGSANESVKAFRQFLNYSIRSIAEIISELHIARNRNYINTEQFRILYVEAEKLIRRTTGFRNSLRNTQ